MDQVKPPSASASRRIFNIGSGTACSAPAGTHWDTTTGRGTPTIRPTTSYGPGPPCPNAGSGNSYYPSAAERRAWAAVPAIVNLTPVPLRTETAGSATVTIELFSPVAGTSPSNTGGAMPTLDDI